ncbi:SAM hydrolase/SAM-dependent halogenase family protein [Chitinophaga qingshengii]|uniref:SAM-dependent chlorinase/fluorinase n=1 Tax=Chitinophaga qingshengii TaxID=1569794 RepID=A0ABR7TY48_9BACT|nr:SAM-dependent chlorinase/fluorinase [Chitinophaga qingshengii]MBC9934409.1 SAM-dependent chlorinase/fluorinase [Chitinophaga qingshengii]
MSIITLTSDIGMQDYLVGAIKGQLWHYCPECHVTDITHHISPFNLPQATYICKSAFAWFPLGTFHFVLINLFDRRPDHVLVAEHNGQYIGCADNGLITMIAGGMPEKVVKIPLPANAPRTTFSMIQALAMAARELSRGKALGEIAPMTQQIQVKHNLQPLVGDDFIEGQIIHIDSFENVVVNITRDQFNAQCKNRRFQIFFRRNEVINQISETYADVPEGQKLAIFNAAGYLEIAINKGNAAGLFGLQGFRRDQLTQPTGFQQLSFYQTVRIIFQ